MTRGRYEVVEYAYDVRRCAGRMRCFDGLVHAVVRVEGALSGKASARTLCGFYRRSKDNTRLGSCAVLTCMTCSEAYDGRPVLVERDALYR